jgi:hypothetical protein
MEIEFNPSRVPSAGPGQPASRQDAVPASTDGASFPVTTVLQEKLKNLQAVRPEQVERAKLLKSDPQYPPDDILDRIAVLLANHVKSQNY